MRGTNRILFVALTATMVLPCSASEWTAIPGRKLEYDKSTVTRKGVTARVWTRARYETPVDFQGLKVRIVLALHELDCGERTDQVLSYRGLMDAESSMELVNSKGSARDFVSPDDPIARLLEVVCR